MSQTNTNTCECNVKTVTLPIRGLSFEVDESALGNGGSGAPMGDMPNLQIGVETRRNMLYMGKQVYSQLVDFGYGTNKSNKVVAHNIPDVEWIQVDVQHSVMRVADGRVQHPVTQACHTVVDAQNIWLYSSANHTPIMAYSASYTQKLQILSLVNSFPSIIRP